MENPQDYGHKRAQGDRWLDLLRPNDRLFVGSAAGEPTRLIEQLLDGSSSKRLPRSLTVYQIPHGGSMRLLRGASPDLRFIGLAGGAEVAAAEATGNVSYIPSTIGQIAAFIERGEIDIDVTLIQVALPDSEGRFSLGISPDFARAAARRSRVVVAQVNKWMPRARGDCFLDADSIHAVVQADVELPERPMERPDDQALSVARHVAELVPDAATIEIGIGGPPIAVLHKLGDRRDLSLHTGLFVSPMIPLIESGVVNNRFGCLPGHVSVASQAIGNRDVVKFLHDNDAVALMPATYTHNPEVLRRQHKFHAINGALEVDLLGRVNSEFLPGRRVSTPGGLLDFVRAARENEDGRSVIALCSTTNSGRTTKIVPRLNSVGTCTVESDLADVIVTEHGIAELSGRSAEDRIRRMISIADPRFRDELTHCSTTLHRR